MMTSLVYLKRPQSLRLSSCIKGHSRRGKAGVGWAEESVEGGENLRTGESGA